MKDEKVEDIWGKGQKSFEDSGVLLDPPHRLTMRESISTQDLPHSISSAGLESSLVILMRLTNKNLPFP